MSLRNYFDPSDHFSSGHQIVSARTYKKASPSWTLNDRKVQELLRSAFPYMKSNKTHREGAARWAAVIHLYFRVGYTRSQIAEELGTSDEKIKNVIRAIYRASKGLKANGLGKRRNSAPKS